MSSRRRGRARPTPPTDLGDLLAGTAGAVVAAQRALDRAADAELRRVEEPAEPELCLPPLAHAFTQVAVELELSARLGAAPTGGSGGGSLRVGTPDRAELALFGREAASGLRVRFEIEPRAGSFAAREREEEP